MDVKHFMKLSVTIVPLFFIVGMSITFSVTAQAGNEISVLKKRIKQLTLKPDYKSDTSYANAINDLAYLYTSTYPDTALRILKGNAERCRKSGYREGEVNAYMFAGDAFQIKGTYNKATENYERAYSIAKEIQYRKALPLILNRIGIIDMNQGIYPEALNKFYESLKEADIIGNNDLRGAALNNIAIIYLSQGNLSEAEKTYRQRLALAEKTKDSSSISLAYNSLGEIELQQKNTAGALQNLAIAHDIALRINDQPMLLIVALTQAEAYYESDSLPQAARLFEESLLLSKQMDNGSYICNALIGLSKTQYRQGLLKQALTYGEDAFARAKKIGQVQLLRDASEIVSNIYESMHNGSQALGYYKIYKLYSDSITNLTTERALAAEKSGYEISKKEAEFARKSLKQQWILFSVVAALILLAVIVWIVNRSRQRLNGVNKELHHKNTMIEVQKKKAEDTLLQLQATQAQLIQSEKMASLGELTAGIAHEIQNPLNFVNNFSEVSHELIDELLTEKSKIISQRDENVEEDILRDLKQNLEKIAHHGKRADAIIKGMLQHSRKNTGQKEQADINALCSEYVRLSYHGLRAKDKSFNAEFTTDFDEAAGKINMVLQDIGRVLLNLFNNAFYAVNKKKKTTPDSYRPTVSVKTQRLNNRVIITVEDNGCGIPKSIADKIFQPFFTTKPTGEGTGLGLSLAYDIITKVHHGSLQVESEENLYTRFVITLPA